MKIRKKHEKGITLVALVITIVVLIILATVSINMILDDDGILGAAELAKDKYQNAAQKEKEDMYELEEYLGESLESVGIVPTVEELQSRYEFKYYSSMTKAVTAVNEGKIADNVDANKEDAVAGIYTNKGNTYVVLLKDTTETSRITLAADMTINLGGNTLTFENDYLGFIGEKNHSDTFTIDGRIEGSTVILNGIDGAGRLFSTRTNTFILDGGSYVLNETVKTVDDMACVVLVFEGGKTHMSNCDISVLSEISDTIGVSCNDNGIVEITKCNISCITKSGKGYGVSNVGTTTLSNCNVKAYSNYTYDGENYVATSIGIMNIGDITLNNCYVLGTHSGVDNNGSLIVNGGTYEGYGHGGFYFAGTGTTSYVRNATIRECAMPEGYTAGSGMDNNAGFYIGGAAGNDNIKVYMDNCNIYGSVQPIVLRGTSGEKNNSLYISNSKINTDKKIRIDNDTHKLYIGVGNNFTADNTNRPSVVETTNETYIKAE